MKKPKKALIIDDERGIYVVLEEILSLKDIDSLNAGSISQAKSLLLDFIPDVIFVDNWLPDGLGSEFIPVLREKCPNSKIVSMTAEVVENVPNMNEDVDSFLPKPFMIRDVFKVLQTLEL